MFRMILTKSVFIFLAMFLFSATGVRAANILFVTADVEPLDADDAYVVTFLEELGHTVILIDDSEDEPTTEAAASEADVVFISESVSSGDIRTEITEIETPMIVAESWGWDEMGLTRGNTGGLEVTSTDIEIVKPGHFLSAGLSGTVQVLNSTGSARFGTGVAGDEATVIARATLSDGITYDVIYVYEKGAALTVAPADGSDQVAAEMRICFGFDERSIVDWNDNAYALLEAAVNYALGVTNQASNPDPSDEQEDVSRDVIMSWEPGVDAKSHNVYLGTIFEDVNSADANSPLLVGPGIDANTFDPNRLKYDRTYYWRVDEVGSPPESEVVTGNVWSFATEPYSIEIPEEDINVTASSYNQVNTENVPTLVIDGSGLTGMSHSDVAAEMWISSNPDEDPWLLFEFDKVQRLDKMLLWNSNTQYEQGLGWSLKDVNIIYSVDDVNWTELEESTQLLQGPSVPDYNTPQSIDFSLAQAKFVKINILNNWSDTKIYCVAEVKFFSIPLQARDPVPQDGAIDVAPETMIEWRAGREADEHVFYFSADQNDVTNGVAPSPSITTNSVDLSPYDVNLGETYYWRVDEVNEDMVPSVWTGKTWSFTAAEMIMVDDFESYNNNSPHRVFQTWLDGTGYSADEYFPQEYNGNGTGSALGHNIWGGESYTIMETVIVSGGSQSLPMYYTGFSETTRTFEPARNWTLHVITKLVVHFYGTAGNTGQLYVKIGETKVPYPGDASDIATEAWTEWEIDLASSGASLTDVPSLTIGIEGSDASGLLYIDDILLK